MTRTFGDPKLVAACAGELQRTFLKYASAVLSGALGQPSTPQSIKVWCISHVSPAGVPYTLIRIWRASIFLAVAADAALGKVDKPEPVNRHERAEFRLEQERERVEETLAESIEDETKSE